MFTKTIINLEKKNNNKYSPTTNLEKCAFGTCFWVEIFLQNQKYQTFFPHTYWFLLAMHSPDNS